MVEPWLTPFLRFVHLVCRSRLARSRVPKIEALATMIRHERRTYDRWLGSPRLVLEAFERYFDVERRSFGWGKLQLVARPKT